MENEGVTGEVLFPNTLPPFYDILAHLSGVPRIEGLCATLGRPAGPQSMACRLRNGAPPSGED